MSELAVVDSGFVYALLDHDDKHHRRAHALLSDARWRFRVPPAIFVEVFHVRLRDAVSKRARDDMTRGFGPALKWLTGPEVPCNQLRSPAPHRFVPHDHSHTVPPRLA